MITVFLDSDVLLDLTLKRQPFLVHALNIFHLIQARKLHAITSSVVFVNTHYFLDKYDRANKYTLLKELRSALTIISVTQDMIDQALTGGMRDFEDAVQFQAAKAANADIIITRNIKDYKNESILVLTPEQYLNTL